MSPKKIRCSPQEVFLNLEAMGNILAKMGNKSLNTAISSKYKHCRSSGQYFAIMGWEIRQYQRGDVQYARYILSEAMLGIYVTPKEKIYVKNNCAAFIKNAKKYDPNLSGMEYMDAGGLRPSYEKSLILTKDNLSKMNVHEEGNSKMIYFQYLYGYLDKETEEYIENNCERLLFPD